MDCNEAQERILDSFIGPLAPEVSRAVAAHCDACATCAAFAVQQQALDARLARFVVPANMSPAFRSALVRRMAAPPENGWREALPEIVHLISWGVATAAGAVMLPLSASVTVGAGLTAALVSYVIVALVRESLDPGVA
jgi:hypothetical protein